MQYQIVTREPLMRFFALTVTRADARLRTPRRDRREHFFLSRCCERCQHSADIVGQSRRERSLKGRRERFSGASEKPCQEEVRMFFHRSLHSKNTVPCCGRISAFLEKTCHCQADSSASHVNFHVPQDIRDWYMGQPSSLSSSASRSSAVSSSSTWFVGAACGS